MPVSELKFMKGCAEWRRRMEIQQVPRNTRGIHALLRKRPKRGAFDVVYIGMAGGARAAIRGRLRSHDRSERRGSQRTYFSMFEVWDNITEEEVRELQGIIRHIYRKDSQANSLGAQRASNKLLRIRNDDRSKW